MSRRCLLSSSPGRCCLAPACHRPLLTLLWARPPLLLLSLSLPPRRLLYHLSQHQGQEATALAGHLDVLLAPRDLDPTFLGWKGGAVLCKLDAAANPHGLWLSPRQWTSGAGMRLLREKAMFPF